MVISWPYQGTGLSAPLASSASSASFLIMASSGAVGSEITRREGLLYGESQDADALARCLLQVLTAPDGGTTLGQAARARALHTHDAAANAATLVGIYETILKGDAQ